MWKDGNKRHFMWKDGNKRHFMCGKDGNKRHFMCGKMEIKDILCVERWK